MPKAFWRRGSGGFSLCSTLTTRDAHGARALKRRLPNQRSPRQTPPKANTNRRMQQRSADRRKKEQQNMGSIIKAHQLPLLKENRKITLTSLNRTNHPKQEQTNIKNIWRCASKSISSKHKNLLFKEVLAAKSLPPSWQQRLRPTTANT